MTGQLAVTGHILLDRLFYTRLKLLTAIEDPLKRAFYEIECMRGIRCADCPLQAAFLAAAAEPAAIPRTSSCPTAIATPAWLGSITGTPNWASSRAR